MIRISSTYPVRISETIFSGFIGVYPNLSAVNLRFWDDFRCSVQQRKKPAKAGFFLSIPATVELVAERAGIRKLDRVADIRRFMGLGAAPAARHGGVGRQGVELRSVLDVAYFLSRSFHG